MIKRRNRPTAYEENTAGFNHIEIRTCLVHPTEDRADTERPDGRIEGIHLDVLPETFRYILQGETSTAWQMGG